MLGSAVAYKLKEDNSIGFELKSQEEKAAEGTSTIEGISPSRLYYPFIQAKLDGAFMAEDTLSMEMSHYLLKKEGIFIGNSTSLETK